MTLILNTKPVVNALKLASKYVTPSYFNLGIDQGQLNIRSNFGSACLEYFSQTVQRMKPNADIAHTLTYRSKDNVRGHEEFQFCSAMPVKFEPCPAIRTTSSMQPLTDTEGQINSIDLKGKNK